MEEQNKKKERISFGYGLIIGVLTAIFLCMLTFMLVVSSYMKKGMVHIGSNGEIYVQPDSIDDSQGIGSDVEAKLNALDSLLNEFYFDDPDTENAKNNIYKAYLASFGDKYTVYYTPEEYKKLLESTTGSFYGIGVVCQKLQEDGSIYVLEAYRDAPAYKAGIRDEDRIIKVDGEDITKIDLSLATTMIKGEKGKEVKLTVKRGDKELEFTVVRDKIDAKTVEYEMLEDNIAYVYIAQFDDVTTAQFKNAIEDLKTQDMKGLIVDIRSNPGGVLTTVVDILDYLLPDGLIMYTQDKNDVKKEYKGKDKNELQVPCAVLVNGNSASASEIFAGAMQDYEKAKIIGTTTFGKGIVQTIRPLTDGSAVKFTISKYYTPKGQDIHGNGVKPDIQVELPTDATDDYQFNAAFEYIRKAIGEDK